MKRYTSPRLLYIDEVGYLSYDNRFTDLLFEVVTRRCDAERAIVLTTNKSSPSGLKSFRTRRAPSLSAIVSFTAPR